MPELARVTHLSPSLELKEFALLMIAALLTLLKLVVAEVKLWS